MTNFKWTEDRIGERFKKLTIIGYGGWNKSRNRILICKCDCGKIYEFHSNNWGRKASCGCYKIELATKHGCNRVGKRNKLYNIWAHMKDRCSNPNNHRYANYGGRGITFDPNWKDFKNFRKDLLAKFIICCLKLGYAELTLERIDVNKGYYKDNCTFIKRCDQNQNTTRTKPIYAINLKTGEKLWFRSQNAAVKQLGLCCSHVCECLYKTTKRKQHHGFKFEFA